MARGDVECCTGLLRLAFLAGVLYFICMAVAHFRSYKYPLLFIYYDVPFYAYQDKIIAFCALTYAFLFLGAARFRCVVPTALMAFFFTVAGLCAVNISPELAEVLNGRSTQAYWIQTGLIAFYWVALLLLYLRSRKKKNC